MTSLLLSALLATMPAPKHSFTIGEQDFLLDGKPFVIRCGEVHFPRVPHEYWRHRLKMCRAMGLNTVCVYLFWNFHEWEQGKYDWKGQADVAEFCRMAQQEGLWVLLRPGPYSCAEWEMGGLPWWLTKTEGLNVRSTDPRFLKPATDYLKEVGRVLGPLQVTHGGPILMAQVENEYGSFGKDAAYMGALRQAMLDGGFDVPLFACNPPYDLQNGYRNDLFQVVNFGAGAAKSSFEKLRGFQKTGPLMNGEYYPAWFDMWGQRHHTGAAEPIVADLEYMLTNRNSFSIYMAHGGTSFGLWAGADRPFRPDTSSYDYDAPISEAGWTTPKFDAIRGVMARHLGPGETLPDPPARNPVVTIPPFTLKETASVFANLPKAHHDETPRTMEFYEQSRGATVYRTTLPAGPAGTLTAKAVHDFAWAFLDGKPVGVMDRRSGRFKLDLPERVKPARLDLLVYAMGRVNFGKEVFDRKGLVAPVEFSGVDLKGWDVFSLPLDAKELSALRYQGEAKGGPAFYRGSFDVPNAGDTFLDVRSWGKGVVWINGHALGRFWNIGPQQTLYVPGPWLKKGRNEVVVLDLLGPRKPELAGLARPILDELHPDLDFARRARATGVFEPNAPVAHGTFTRDAQWQEVRFSGHGRYVALEALTGNAAAVAELDILDPSGTSLPKTNWRVIWASSEETNTFSGDAENAIDGQTASFWHTDAVAQAPHRIVIDLGEAHDLGGLRYLPRPGRPDESGRIGAYRIYLGDTPFGLKPSL